MKNVSNNIIFVSKGYCFYVIPNNNPDIPIEFHRILKHFSIYMIQY